MLLSYSTLALLILALAIFGLWLDSARARETANRVAVETCRRNSVQLLDGTVALAKLRPRLESAGLRLERTYVFDYAIGGAERASGFVVMQGREILHVGLAAK